MECKLLTNGFFLYPEIDKSFQSKPCCHFKSKDLENLNLDTIQNTFTTSQRVDAINSLKNNVKHDSCVT